MLTAASGDLFTSRAQTLVNTVNCIGVMGKGIALEFKKRYPAMFEDYVARCRLKQVRLGEPYLFRDLGGTMILNFPTKDHWRSPSRLKDIDDGLEYFVKHAADWGVTSVAFPPLGCGNGGLAWADVEPLIHRRLCGLSMAIEIYAPSSP
jgi:O-acetyl-ADP-ribose deacetylase (regulator of RNase III)